MNFKPITLWNKTALELPGVRNRIVHMLTNHPVEGQHRSPDSGCPAPCNRGAVNETEQWHS